MKIFISENGDLKKNKIWPLIAVSIRCINFMAYGYITKSEKWYLNKVRVGTYIFLKENIL